MRLGAPWPGRGWADEPIGEAPQEGNRGWKARDEVLRCCFNASVSSPEANEGTARRWEGAGPARAMLSTCRDRGWPGAFGSAQNGQAGAPWELQGDPDPRVAGGGGAGTGGRERTPVTGAGRGSGPARPALLAAAPGAVGSGALGVCPASDPGSRLSPSRSDPDPASRPPLPGSRPPSRASNAGRHAGVVMYRNSAHTAPRRARPAAPSSPSSAPARRHRRRARPLPDPPGYGSHGAVPFPPLPPAVSASARGCGAGAAGAGGGPKRRAAARAGGQRGAARILGGAW